MSSKKLPQRPSGRQDINAFLHKANHLVRRTSSVSANSGRIIFALDATASRQPSWDRACQLQSEMFLSSAKLGNLQLQLCYYRGFNEFHHSPWLNNSETLLHTMAQVQCLGGYTQIGKVLDHSLQENTQNPVQAVVIIADAMEENIDTLCASAGQLGMVKVPLFMFQEGKDSKVEQCFRQMATLSRGAYATFDEGSAGVLSDLLSAVATFAMGGREALQKLQTATAKHLLQQLKY